MCYIKLEKEVYTLFILFPFIYIHSRGFIFFLYITTFKC